MRNVNQILAHKAGRLVTVPKEAPVLEVIRLMAEHHIGSVLVMQGAELVGIATERDLPAVASAAGRNSSRVLSHAPSPNRSRRPAAACPSTRCGRRCRSRGRARPSRQQDPGAAPLRASRQGLP